MAAAIFIYTRLYPGTNVFSVQLVVAMVLMPDAHDTLAEPQKSRPAQAGFCQAAETVVDSRRELQPVQAICQGRQISGQSDLQGSSVNYL
ncbi:hypothetical protein [Marinobacter changyiensis]|uniref:hypothetical protein n=1 Tax=Marinobacter changyiensis TaxID=2604091 RepID=UPI001265955B|nr:hypothetical protein [Marinobacter changyiensis]